MASSSSKTKSSSNKLYSYSTSNAPFSTSSPNFASSTSSSTFFNKPHTQTHTHSHHHHHHQRSASPTRVNLTTGSLSNFGFSIDQRSISPNRTVPSHVISKKNHHHHHQKKTCMCSPTTHPGSFRCSLHKNISSNSLHHGESYPSSRLNMRRSAMKNSLVRIGGVEGEWVKRALTALIRPSSHQQKRRDAFEPRSSRLSVMSKADE
ncbi:unnamed protein product [Lathyrus oleraceus]|uniref:Serine-rich protein-like protein n=1 Tax=Pisum sativum TaxID=3888 RepID=A0A9D4W2B0_PEA|nr:uncharacterized protein LOC127093154 [Pisum sativum]KAI5393768.1 hypothetical protein KIW84_060763 [Pisum sativum]